MCIPVFKEQNFKWTLTGFSTSSDDSKSSDEYNPHHSRLTTLSRPTARHLTSISPQKSLHCTGIFSGSLRQSDAFFSRFLCRFFIAQLGIQAGQGIVIIMVFL